MANAVIIGAHNPLKHRPKGWIAGTGADTGQAGGLVCTNGGLLVTQLDFSRLCFEEKMVARMSFM